jgi:hypothetical protein
LIAEVALALGADPSADPASWSWTDITAFTFDRDGNSSITVQRGRTDEMTDAQPATCRLQLRNTDGRFLARNPTGPYFGQLRRNTPIRVRVNPGSGLATRFVGFVNEWPPRWSPGEVDHYVAVRAAGILRRLQQGASPLKSALTRSVAASDPIRYWPMELADAGDVRQFYSAVNGVAPLTVVNTVSPADSVVGSEPVAAFDLASFFVAAPISLADAGHLVVSSVMAGHMAASPAPTIWVPWRVGFTGGTVTDFRVVAYAGWSGGAFTSTVGLDVQLNLVGIVSTFGTAGANLFDPANPPRYISVVADQNGANVDLQLWVDGTLIDSGSAATVTLGAPSLLSPPRAAPGGTLDAIAVDNTGTSFTFGHLSVHDAAVDPAALAFAARGYVGELAGDRFARLCAEEGIVCDVQ